MNKLIQYIDQTLGVHLHIEPVYKERLGRLPIFINEAYLLYTTVLFNRELLLVEPRTDDHFTVLQIEKHHDLLRESLGKIVVLVMQNLPAYNRKRLIERGINFIVPDKQLYLPELLINLTERYTKPRRERAQEKLLPSAQFLLIHHIIHRNEIWQMEEHSFKEIANSTGYTQMAITKAVENLRYHDIIDVSGEKEKYIKFRLDRGDLWRDIINQDLLINPVFKRVFVDQLPGDPFMLYTNASALPEYTDLNPVNQQYRAIGKRRFYELQAENKLINVNGYEGAFCIEVWKYDPLKLAAEMSNDLPVVDPLSLYLSLRDNEDERVEMALEQIIEKFIW